jgi:hypothetical protein
MQNPTEPNGNPNNRMVRKLLERYKNIPLGILFSPDFTYTSKHAAGRTKPRNLKAKKKKARKQAYKSRKRNRRG